MTTRDELIEAGTQAMVFAGMNYGKPIDERMAEACVDMVEPLIRADEREREHVVSLLISQKMKWEADLRAKVEALLPERPQPQYLSGWDAALADVLALIDGSSK